MLIRWSVLIGFAISLWIAPPLHAKSADISNVIESFVAKQFPEARGHFWVVNGTQWQAEDEMVVDLNTVVIGQLSPSPTESRFLLLIVGGKLAATQHIPLDSAVDCQSEQA